MPSSVSVLSMQICVSLLILDLLLHVLLMQSDHSFLQLLEIRDMVEHLKHIILEFLLQTILFVKGLF